MFLEEVAVLAGREVLVEVDDNGRLIVGNLEGTLGQQLRPCQIHMLKIITIEWVTY